jgi:hypothetical protein
MVSNPKSVVKQIRLEQQASWSNIKEFLNSNVSYSFHFYCNYRISIFNYEYCQNYVLQQN